ncbi:SNF2-related protein [Umezawaea tangerina]|uniref:SNF2 domain-containing protein n=1 Tax=Umezawaea tangerina TaxID=84725 RepID=A0A2T0SNY6_9PSEU|nr:SNF2-related protein [Umezawaea tangerina]PRY35127.1 SNF2 domain-containing protein [Umezawaea tangerina]
MTKPSAGTRPEFATNDEAKGDRVASAINSLLSYLRGKWVEPPALAIATAYFNPAGFGLLAEELEKAGPVRLLLGAEPTDAGQLSRVRPLGRRQRRRGPSPEVVRALEGHARSLLEDRDLLGFTLEADMAARRLVAWIEEHPGVEVRRYERGFLHGKAFIVESDTTGVIAGSSNFTYAGLARNNELNLGHYQPTTVGQVLAWFDEQWGKAIPYDLAGLYKARWEPYQPLDVFLRMLHENYGADLEDATVGSKLGLTAFQADGVWRAKRILDRRNGVLIADEVGLGKTYLAGELIYEATVVRRQKVLIICPATLRDSTWTGFLRHHNLRADVLSYEELASNIDTAGNRTSALQDLDEYAMVVIDEAHAFRNNATRRAEALHRIVDSRVPKDLVLLTATPVNNSLEDLYSLIMYFARNDYAFADVGIPSLRQYFNRAIATDPDSLTAQHLFDVLDATAVRRTRRFVKNHYRGDRIRVNGVEQEVSFPTCEVRRVDYDLAGVLPGVFDALATSLGAHVAEEIMTSTVAAGVILADIGQVLTMARYVPSQFRLDGDTEQYEAQNAGLLRSALLKRFESSAHAFRSTVAKMITSHARFLNALEAGYVLTGENLRDFVAVGMEGAEDFLVELEDDEGTMDASNYDVDALRGAVQADQDILTSLHDRVGHIDHTTDPKVERLVGELATIAAEAAAEGIGEEDTRNKRKVLVFTYFADTADYIHTAVRNAVITDERLRAYRDRHAKISGSDGSDRTGVITGFAPRTAGAGDEEDLYDLIITTDVLAEGVNLQQARHIINYDLPWNPMKLVQRHGRIDRIGSLHKRVFMRCFFPDEDLDRLLGLEERLQRKLKQAAAAVGVGTVLPGVDPVERSITETREMIDRIKREEATLFEEGGSAALSGEEYRRRLADAFKNTATRTRVIGLPWGSGGAIARRNADPGFVFCARVGDHDRPFHRYVPLDEDLTTRTVRTADGDLVAEIVRDTLACLNQADPGDRDAPAVELAEPMYRAAFDAWVVARADVHRDWSLHTDPGRLSPPLPKVMRKAVEYVEGHGAFLGERQDDLASRLRAPYTNRVQRAVRGALAHDEHGTPQETVERIAAVADEYGLSIPEPPIPLPPANLEDVHLVCWTAIVPVPEVESESERESGS